MGIDKIDIFMCCLCSNIACILFICLLNISADKKPESFEFKHHDYIRVDKQIIHDPDCFCLKGAR